MPSITATTTTTQEVRLEPKLKAKLLKELREYQVLQEQKKALEEKLDRKKDTIGALRDETGETSLELAGFKVTLVAGVQSRLDQKKLIAEGVTPAQIEAATVVTPKKAYNKITLPGAKDE